MNKQALAFADVEALGTLELPSREMMGYLLKVTVGDVTVFEDSFNDLVDAQRVCANIQVGLLQKAECEITGGGGINN
jgi:hypothetical protein